MIEARRALQLKRADLLIISLIMQISLVFSVIFNISAAQVALGFLYVSLLPGIIIARLLTPKLERVEQIIFAVGISIAFFMGIGLLINFFGPVVGTSKPLGLVPIFVTSSIIIDALAFYEWRTSDQHVENVSAKPKNRKLKLVALLLCFLPLLSIIGTISVSVSPYSNNIILLLMFLAIAVLIISTAIYKQLPSNMYVFIIFSIALALLFQFAFFTKYLVGGDIFGEFSAFNLTFQNSFWDVQNLGRLNAMLSVTMLPTIYCNITGISGTWVFKVFYSLLFSLVPVGLFQLFKSQFDKKIAFFSAFFFMSNYMFFLELAQLPRQMVGELFFVLLFLTLIKKDIQQSSKLVLFTIFGFGIIVSHYAMAYIFFGFLVAIWLVGFIRKRKGAVTLSMILIFATILLTWYIYTTQGSTFADLVTTLQRLSQNFISDFFNSQSRGTTVMAGLGAPVSNTFLKLTGQYLYLATELFILVGVLITLIKNRWYFFKNSYNIFVLFSLLLLFACVIVPNFASSFNMERFYHVSLFFLAPFCIIGGIYLFEFISRKKIHVKYLGLILIIFVLVPVFLFQTGFIYEVTREESYAFSLSSYRFSSFQFAFSGILHSTEVTGADWILQNRISTTKIYSDLTSSGLFAYYNIENSTVMEIGSPVVSGSLAYLRQYILNTGTILTSSYNLVNFTQVCPSIESVDVVYSSGYCEILRTP